VGGLIDRLIVFASITIKIILQIVASVHCGASIKFVDFDRTPGSSEVCPARKLEVRRWELSFRLRWIDQF
jgi:hypothetical protein